MSSRCARLALAAALLLGVGGAAGPVAAAKPAPQEVLRLHIVANSDRAQDIAAKVAVRTVLLGFLQGRLAGAQSAREAATRLEDLTPAMTRIADETLRGYGLPYRARIALGTAVLPVRRYLGQRLPAGRYLTLEVVLGRGRGQNWWCMLFPELCLSDAGAAVGGSQARAMGPRDFVALGSGAGLPTAMQVRPGGLLWRFWELVRPSHVHGVPFEHRR